MMCYEAGDYVFTLKQNMKDAIFRVWNNELEDYELIRIIEETTISNELLKDAISSFINNKIDLLKVILNGLDKIGD